MESRFLERLKEFVPWPKFFRYLSIKLILSIPFDSFSLTVCNIVNDCH